MTAAVVVLPLAVQAGESTAARPFHEAAVRPTVGGMAGSAMASIGSVDAMLRAATQPARTSAPSTAPQETRRAAVPTRPDTLGLRRSAALPTGGMEGALRDIIAMRMGDQSCQAITDYRITKGGSGFFAQCDDAVVFVVEKTGRHTHVAACAQPSPASLCADAL